MTTPKTTEPTPLPWRGSTFTFNQAATTTSVGIGRDNIGGEDEFYGWEFTLRPNFYLIDLPKDKLAAIAEIGLGVELTKSNTTADNREPQFRDIQLGLRYTRSIWESAAPNKGENATTGRATLRFLLPTAPTSYDQGKYLIFAIGPDIRQKIKLLGSKANGLNNVTVGLGITYSHLFSDATTPTTGDFSRPQRNASSQTFDSDQISGSRLEVDRITIGPTLNIPLYKGLALDTAYRLRGGRLEEFDDAGCVQIDTGCAPVQQDATHTNYRVLTSFDLALSYSLYDVVNVALGYNNETRQLGEDGKRRNFFYSPDAQFYLDIIANLDVIYSKATNRGDQPASTALKGAKHEF